MTFEIFSLRYMRQIIHALKDDVLTILFAKGAWGSIPEMVGTGAARHRTGLVYSSGNCAENVGTCGYTAGKPGSGPSAKPTT
jgi:hypothetical protein